MNRRAIFRRLAFAFLVAAVLACWWFLPQARALAGQMVDRAQALGYWGPVLLALIYIPAALLLVPGSWLTLAGAFTFGWWRAAIAVSLGSTLGACASFLTGRYLARNWVAQKLAGDRRFRALDGAVTEQGFKIVLLCRLSPLLPYGLLNYGFGLTSIPLARYAVASWIGMLPATVAYAYVGAAAGELSELQPRRAAASMEGRVILLAGLVATVTLTIIMTRIAARALRRTVSQEAPAPRT